MDVFFVFKQIQSQPCYWRNVKSVRKREAGDEYGIESEKNSSLSENVNLFQALRVLQEDEEDQAARADLTNHESVCVKTGIFTAMIGKILNKIQIHEKIKDAKKLMSIKLVGLGTLILVILAISTMIMCFRLRRVKTIGDTDASDILRPYSHHANPPHHWSSSSISKR